MAGRKKGAAKGRKPGAQAAAGRAAAPRTTRTRLQRSDEDKIRMVRQVMESGNQSAEIKNLGIYPNQFYDWKKKYAAQLGGVTSTTARGRRATGPGAAAYTVAEEAKAFINGKSALLDRLRRQREELDHLISELEH